MYQFVTLPFGLCNAPSTFERLMERAMSGLQWYVAVLYLDDVIVKFLGHVVSPTQKRLGLCRIGHNR